MAQFRAERDRQDAMSAASAVLGTTELLEAILLYLPPRDTLLGQLVCRKWRNVISTSSRLQQKLFFKVSPSTPVHYQHINSIPRLRSPPPDYRWRRWERLEDHPPRWSTGNGEATKVAANPFLDLVFDVSSIETVRVRGEPRAGSWEDMHVSSPPSSVIKVVFAIHGAKGQTRRMGEDRIVQDRTGIRMRDVFDMFSVHGIGGMGTGDSMPSLLGIRCWEKLWHCERCWRPSADCNC